MKTFVVVPAYNEGTALGQVLDELLALRPQVEVVVVDDCSSDDTYVVATRRPVHVLGHVVNLGQGAALRTGMDYALELGADTIVTFDADGQMCAGDLTAVVQPVLDDEVDVVLGTRFGEGRVEGITRARRWLLRAALVFTRLTTRLAVTDVHNGFRAFSRSALQSMRLTQDRMAHASEICHEIARLRLRWREVSVTIRYTDYSRRKGQSALGAIDIVVDLVMRNR